MQLVEHSGTRYRLTFKHWMEDSIRKVVDRVTGEVKEILEKDVWFCAAVFQKGAEKPKWNDVVVGLARCSKQDRYDREEGRRIAIRRAYRSALNSTLPKDVAVALIRTYFQRYRVKR